MSQQIRKCLDAVSSAVIFRHPQDVPLQAGNVNLLQVMSPVNGRHIKGEISLVVFVQTLPKSLQVFGGEFGFEVSVRGVDAQKVV
jgi:hypothetical protein